MNNLIFQFPKLEFGRGSAFFWVVLCDRDLHKSFVTKAGLEISHLYRPARLSTTALGLSVEVSTVGHPGYLDDDWLWHIYLPARRRINPGRINRPNKRPCHKPWLNLVAITPISRQRVSVSPSKGTGGVVLSLGGGCAITHAPLTMDNPRALRATLHGMHPF